MSQHHSFFRSLNPVAWRGFAVEPIALVLVTVSVWAGVTFSAVSWLLRDGASVRDTAAVADESLLTQDIDPQAVARALGAQSPKTNEAASNVVSRFQLMGVLNGDPSTGVALISVDGKTAKPYRVGKTVTDGLVVQSTQAKRVNLGPTVDGPTTLSLDLPAKK